MLFSRLFNLFCPPEVSLTPDRKHLLSRDESPDFEEEMSIYLAGQKKARENLDGKLKAEKFITQADVLTPKIEDLIKNLRACDSVYQEKVLSLTKITPEHYAFKVLEEEVSKAFNARTEIENQLKEMMRAKSKIEEKAEKLLNGAKLLEDDEKHAAERKDDTAEPTRARMNF